ncbi:MAG: hypothetical protein K8U03_24900 [Planctomycetia bacterium]|nr:hypothetical protein [Planctomycetia bacterium]
MPNKLYARQQRTLFLLFASLVAPASSAVADYVEDRQAAMKLTAAGKHEEAFAAFRKLAQGKVTPFQQTDALEHASQCALRLKRLEEAMEVAKQIPLPAHAKLAQMRVLGDSYGSNEIVKQFGDEDLLRWPDGIIADGAFARGSAWFVVKDGSRAEQDLLLAASYATEENLRGQIWLSLGATYRQYLKDDAKAIAAYRRTYETANEFKHCSAAVAIAGILRSQSREAEAQAELQRIDERKMTIPVYRDMLLKAKAATVPNHQ